MNATETSRDTGMRAVVPDLPAIEAAVRQLRMTKLHLEIAERDRVEAGRAMAEADDALTRARRAYSEAQYALFDVAEQQDGNLDR